MSRIESLKHAIAAGWSVFYQVWTFCRGVNPRTGAHVECVVTHKIEFQL